LGEVSLFDFLSVSGLTFQKESSLDTDALQAALERTEIFVPRALWNVGRMPAPLVESEKVFDREVALFGAAEKCLRSSAGRSNHWIFGIRRRASSVRVLREAVRSRRDQWISENGRRGQRKAARRCWHAAIASANRSTITRLPLTCRLSAHDRRDRLCVVPYFPIDPGLHPVPDHRESMLGLSVCLRSPLLWPEHLVSKVHGGIDELDAA
jgi:hypothetical protein